MKIVSFVILHYGDHRTTDACIRSILRMEQQQRLRIVVVDNDIHKHPALREKLRERYKAWKNILVLTNCGSGGFSQANNLGYRYSARRLGASYVLLLNNDIVFTQKNFVELMEAAYEQEPCHVLGPDVIRAGTGEHQNPMDIRLRTRQEAEWTIRKNRAALKLYPLLYPLLYWNQRRCEKNQTQERASQKEFYEERHKDIVPFGACLIFTPAYVEREENALVPETDFYYEEYILACRCRRNQYTVVYDPRMKALHESGKATEKRFRGEYGKLRFRMEKIAESCAVYRSVLEQNSDGKGK